MQDAFAFMKFMLVAILLAVFAAVFSGCAGNPIAEAEEPDEKVKAAVDLYGIYQGQALELLGDELVPNSYKRAIVEADAAISPLVIEHEPLLREYMIYKNQIAVNTESRLQRVAYLSTRLGAIAEEIRDLIPTFKKAIATARRKRVAALAPPRHMGWVIA